MGRPAKHNADYFPHDTGMRDDKKLKAVRARFKLEGYAVYNMLLESITESDLICVKWNQIEIEMLAGDFGIESERLVEMVDYFCTIDLFQKVNGHIFCRQLDRRLKPVFDKRKVDLGSLRSENGVSDTETNKSVETTELPSRDSKVKKSKEKKINTVFTSLAEKLKDIVCSHKGIKINGQKINGWANSIRLMVEMDGIDSKRIDVALDEYAKIVGAQYVPDIQSGDSLRKKFLNLEAAIKRVKNGESKKYSGKGFTDARSAGDTDWLG